MRRASRHVRDAVFPTAKESAPPRVFHGCPGVNQFICPALIPKPVVPVFNNVMLDVLTRTMPVMITGEN